MFIATRKNEVRKFDSATDARRFSLRMADQLSQLWIMARVVNGRAVRLTRKEIDQLISEGK